MALSQPLVTSPESPVQVLGTCSAPFTPGSFNYIDFSDTSKLCLVPAALKLTDTATGKSFIRVAPRPNPVTFVPVAGALWHGTRQQVVRGFETQFRFRISNPDAISGTLKGGDGLAFVIQNQAQTVVGWSGGYIGYGGITNSLALEFDTFRNSDANDPQANHIGVQASVGQNTNQHNGPAKLIGPIAVGPNAEIGAWEDGQIHTALIRYLPDRNHRFEVYVDDSVLVVTYIDIGARAGLGPDGLAWVGFTSAMNRSQANFDILSWQFNSFTTDVPGDTVGVYRHSAATGGTFYLRNSNTTGTADTTITLSYAASVDMPVVGDWNGDGLDTPGVFSPTNSLWRLSNSSTSGTYAVPDTQFFYTSPLAGYDRLPIVGDWDGDGRDTVGIYFRPQPATQSLGLFYLRNSNDTGDYDAYVYLGFAGDAPVSGDWNGDGKDTVGVYTLSGTYGGLWTLVNQNIPSPTYTYVWYGVPPGTRPVVGDWNGTGDMSVGLQQPNATTGANVFFLKNSNSSGPNATNDPVFFYGIPTDQPLAGNWVAFCTAGGSGSGGSSPSSGGVCAQLPTPTVTPTQTPTKTPIPINFMTQTATAAAGLPNSVCGLKTAKAVPLMDSLLTTQINLIPKDAIIIATQGRGRLQNQPGGYPYVEVTYGVNTGWIHTYASEVTYLNIAMETACLNLPLIRLDYHAPSPLHTGGLYYDYAGQTALNCVNLPANKIQDGVKCVYNAFMPKFIQLEGRLPTVKDLITATVQAEWWDYRSEPSDQGTIGMLGNMAAEGTSRAYFSAGNCSRGVCQPHELFNFLGGYQPWLLVPGNPDPNLADQTASILIGKWQQAKPNAGLINPVVEDILTLVRLMFTDSKR